MEMDLEFDSETPPSSPVIGYSAPVSTSNFNSDEYCFQCKGQIRPSDPTFSPSGPLAMGELISAIKILSKNTSFEHFDTDLGNNSYKFFNFPFRPDSLKIFVQICRKNIHMLENYVQPCPTAFEFDSEGEFSVEMKPWNIRKDICNFLNFALKYSNIFRSHSNLLDVFIGLRRSLERIETWPASLKNHGGFEDGNKCTSSYYHFFHLQLELRWFFLILSGVSPEVLNWVLDDMVYLAWFKFSTEKMSEWSPKISNKVPFNCYCVKEFWTMVRQIVDDVKPLGKDFWEFLTSALNRFDKTNDQLFPLWLTVSLAPLGSYDLKGQYVTCCAEEQNHCYYFVKELVKNCMGENGHLNEVMDLTCKLLPFWGSDDGVAQCLWNFWAGRLEKNAGVQDNSYWKSPEKWLCLIKSLVGELDEGSVPEADDFFQFLKVFCGHVRFYPKGRKVQKLINMIYLKLPDSKVVNFNEIGLIRLSSLHLAAIAAAKDEDTLSIAKTFNNSYANMYANLTKKNRHILLRTVLTAQATMYLILLEKSINISSVFQPFMDQIASLMLRESKLQIDPKKRELTMIYLEFLDATPKSSCKSKTDLGQTNLISPNLPIWLSSTSPDYLNRTLRVLHNLLQWQIDCPTVLSLVRQIYSLCHDFVKTCAYRRNSSQTDLEPLADLAADFTFAMHHTRSVSMDFFDTFALEAWVRLICTGVNVPRKLTMEVLEDTGELFGYSNDSLLELFCIQATASSDWERKDVEEILKCLVDLCKNNWMPLKENLGMVQATINSSKIVLTKLKFTKLYSPKVPCVATFILDFYTKFLNSLSDDDICRIWFTPLSEVFGAITTSYTIWENDAYLKRQIQTMITAAFLDFSSNDYVQRNTDNHPAVKIMKLALDSDNVTVLEEILPNLKLTILDSRSNPTQNYLRTLALFTPRNVNMLPVIVYSLPGILRIVRISGTNAELPACSELICSVLNPGNSTMSPVILKLKMIEAFRKELEGNLSLNYRKYFKLFSVMLSAKVNFRSEVRKFLKDELLPVVIEQIKLCERLRGTGQNDTVWKCFQMFEAELERSAL
ncbi:unnamed protein product [Allacma fusca]|uniref:Protein MMS22-like n=1 Tax=Allacma fusca TaxID=39272 RepID=A0A8J2KPZ0_9HEXA|nr:unnamed protein product [Allacma fusca]